MKMLQFRLNYKVNKFLKQNKNKQMNNKKRVDQINKPRILMKKKYQIKKINKFNSLLMKKYKFNKLHKPIKSSKNNYNQ